MTFFTIVVRGLMRRPVRTGLTLLGISIGIAAVVALVGLSRGLDRSWAKGMKARGTDVVVSNMGSALTPKPFNASVSDRIAHLSRVAATCSSLIDLTSVETAQMMIVSGRQWNGFTWQNLKLVSGRMPHDPDEPAVVLGQVTADTLKKKVGDRIQIETSDLSVVGIINGGAWVENSSVILSLPLLQKITGNQGKINIIDIRVTPGTNQKDVEGLCEQINRLVPEARAMPGSANVSNSEVYRILQAMSWGTSLLATLVGVLGVMNTMLMAVSERKQEISILLALGWRRRRIISMVLWESGLLGLFGGVTGVMIGAVGVQILGTTPAIRDLLRPDVSMGLLAISVTIAVAVGVLSGLYPAWRSSRLPPALALQG